jgi:predicted metal-binding membrane protein
MWIVMMVAMMLPSLVPMLWRYRRALVREPVTVFGASRWRLAALTALVGSGYFFVWTLFGVLAFPLGVSFATISMAMPAVTRAVPVAIGVVVVLAGVLQFTAWKGRHLACCRGASGTGCVRSADFSTAWKYGVRLGLHCAYCCAGLTAVLLVIGVMDVRAMAVVGGAITLERLAPAGQRIAKIIGVVVVAAGLYLIAREAGLG